MWSRFSLAGDVGRLRGCSTERPVPEGAIFYCKFSALKSEGFLRKRQHTRKTTRTQLENDKMAKVHRADFWAGVWQCARMKATRKRRQDGKPWKKVHIAI